MASFYICHNQKTPYLVPNQQPETLDAVSACKILRKAALKLPEMAVKLEVSKVIRYLESTQSQSQTTHPNVHQSPQIRKSHKRDEQVTFKEVENVGYQTPSIMQIITSKSLMSFQQDRQLEQNESIYKQLMISELSKEKPGVGHRSNKQNRSSLIQTFNLREVVTKNVLEEAEGSRKVRFKDQNQQQSGVEKDKRGFQNFLEENSKLKKHFLELFRFFKAKQLIQLSQPLLNLQFKDIESLSKQLFGNFDKREVQHEFQKKKFNEVKSEYLSTLKNISIDLRVEADKSKVDQTSIVQPLQNEAIEIQNLSSKVKELVNVSSKVEQMRREVSEMGEKLKQKEDQIKKYEMMLFIKEEQISSLRVMNSNLENRIKKLTKSDEKPRSRSYKKFFEHLDQDFSATVS